MAKVLKLKKNERKLICEVLIGHIQCEYHLKEKDIVEQDPMLWSKDGTCYPKMYVKMHNNYLFPSYNWKYRKSCKFGWFYTWETLTKYKHHRRKILKLSQCRYCKGVEKTIAHIPNNKMSVVIKKKKIQTNWKRLCILDKKWWSQKDGTKI